MVEGAAVTAWSMLKEEKLEGGSFRLCSSSLQGKVTRALVVGAK